MVPLKIAFVGSGGAARGIAHLGVLKACEEVGIVPTIFVGTSAGAVVAATYGQDIPLDVLLDAYRLPWRRRHNGPRLYMRTFMGAPSARDLLDPGYLLSGVFSMNRLERYLERFLPENDFARIDNQILVTAVDVDSGERVVFGRGHRTDVPISKAVAASCSVPGLFRPMKVGDQYLMDAEVKRTLSLDLAINAGANVIIISNVYRPELRAPGERSLARSGPFGVFRQAVNLVMSEKERRGVELLRRTYPRVAFLDIAPDIGEFSYANRYNARSLVLRGYRSALRTLTEAKERGVFDEVNGSDAALN
jgi:NTE family protein